MYLQALSLSKEYVDFPWAGEMVAVFFFFPCKNTDFNNVDDVLKLTVISARKSI